MKKFLLLGSGELGKEFVISCKRYGHYVLAADSYDNAPAMQVADEKAIINMLDGDALETLVNSYQPDIIIPEIEAIRTEKLFEFESQGVQVAPSAKAVNYTMDRKAIRDLASKELKLKTAKYAYATSLEELIKNSSDIGYPAVIKPLMSSSGKGQSVVKSKNDLKQAWEYACSGSRGDKMEVIIEEFIQFDFEITLLTVTQKNGITLFCPPIGHIQSGGDYQESWQPMIMDEKLLSEAQEMANKVTQSLGGYGLWGVEFFIGKDVVYFSELSPRPHDTGMVTLAGSQNYSEFELHLRAVLGMPIPNIKLNRIAANAVILAKEESNNQPTYEGIESVCEDENADIRIFGKPSTRINRRMGIVIKSGDKNENIDQIRKDVKDMASKVTINGLKS